MTNCSCAHSVGYSKAFAIVSAIRILSSQNLSAGAQLGAIPQVRSRYGPSAEHRDAELPFWPKYSGSSRLGDPGKSRLEIVAKIVNNARMGDYSRLRLIARSGLKMLTT